MAPNDLVIILFRIFFEKLIITDSVILTKNFRCECRKISNYWLLLLQVRLFCSIKQLRVGRWISRIEFRMSIQILRPHRKRK